MYVCDSDMTNIQRQSHDLLAENMILDLRN